MEWCSPHSGRGRPVTAVRSPWDPFEFTYQSSLERESTTRAAPHLVGRARVLGNLLTETSSDMMRQLLQNMINALLSAGAEWGQPPDKRLVQCNGYRHRPLKTRVGTIDMAVPKLVQAATSPSDSSNAATEPR